MRYVFALTMAWSVVRSSAYSFGPGSCTSGRPVAFPHSEEPVGTLESGGFVVGVDGPTMETIVGTDLAIFGFEISGQSFRGFLVRFDRADHVEMDGEASSYHILDDNDNFFVNCDPGVMAVGHSGATVRDRVSGTVTVVLNDTWVIKSNNETLSEIITMEVTLVVSNQFDGLNEWYHSQYTILLEPQQEETIQDEMDVPVDVDVNEPVTEVSVSVPPTVDMDPKPSTWTSTFTPTESTDTLDHNKENKELLVLNNCTRARNVTVMNDVLWFTYAVRSSTVDGHPRLVLDATLEYVTDEPVYVALGIPFRPNIPSMVGATAIIGVPDDSDSEKEVQLYDVTSYFVEGVIPLPKDDQTLLRSSLTFRKDATSNNNNGIMTLQFTKYLTGEPESHNSILGSTDIDDANDRQVTFVFALGDGPELAFHRYSGGFTVPLSLDCASSEARLEGLSNLASFEVPLLQLHGILAALAWAVAVPLAVSASLLRQFFVVGWFRWHFYLNVIATVLTVAATVVAVYGLARLGKPHLTKRHHTVGVALTVLVMVQVVTAMLRPHRSNDFVEKRRWVWSHRLMGVLLLVASVYQMVTGPRLQHELYRPLLFPTHPKPYAPIILYLAWMACLLLWVLVSKLWILPRRRQQQRQAKGKDPITLDSTHVEEFNQ